MYIIHHGKEPSETFPMFLEELKPNGNSVKEAIDPLYEKSSCAWDLY